MANVASPRVFLIAAGAVALTVGLFVAMTLGPRMLEQNPEASAPGLTVQTGKDDDIKLDPKRPLRCFVAGRLVGELPLDQCAKRNGLASGALDVGLDSSGALAASGGTGQVTPLPPSAPSASVTSTPDTQGATQVAEDTPVLARGGPAPCWRYADGAWNVMARPMSLGACAQSLYDGECARAGSAAYGRWGDHTLRLVAGRVEISRDNRVFRLLAEQGAGCVMPNLD